MPSAGALTRPATISALDLDREQRREDRNAAHEVRGRVDRVDDQARARAARLLALLLAVHAELGPALGDELARGGLDVAVRLGDQAAVGLLLDAQVDAAEEPARDLVGAVGDLGQERQPVGVLHAPHPSSASPGTQRGSSSDPRAASDSSSSSRRAGGVVPVRGAAESDDRADRQPDRSASRAQTSRASRLWRSRSATVGERGRLAARQDRGDARLAEPTELVARANAPAQLERELRERARRAALPVRALVERLPVLDLEQRQTDALRAAAARA